MGQDIVKAHPFGILIFRVILEGCPILHTIVQLVTVDGSNQFREHTLFFDAIVVFFLNFWERFVIKKKIKSHINNGNHPENSSIISMKTNKAKEKGGGYFFPRNLGPKRD